MKATRTWLVLLALVAAAAAGLLVSVPRLLQREMDTQVAARLSGATQGAELLLEMHSRRWIDATARAAGDAMLSESLDQATRGGMSAELLHRTIQERLARWTAEWKAFQVVAVEGHGRVVARAGADEGEWKDELMESPIVSEALRGWRLDDTWSVGGKLYRATASPVIYHERYVGALLVLEELGATLLDGFSDSLSVELGVVVDGKLAARSHGSKLLDGTPALAAEHAQELKEHGRSAPRPVRLGGESQEKHALAALSLPGDAALQQATLVLVSDRPRVGTLVDLLGRLSPEQFLDGNLPAIARFPELVYVGAGLLVALFFGFVLTWFEHGRPLARLLRSSQRLGRGEINRIDDKFGGALGHIVRAVNAAVERVSKTVAPKTIAVETAPAAFIRGTAADVREAHLDAQQETTYIPPPAPYAPSPTPASMGSSPALASLHAPATQSFHAPSIEARHAPPPYVAPPPPYTPPPAPLYAPPSPGSVYGQPDALALAELDPPWSPSAPAGVAESAPTMGAEAAPAGSSLLSSLDEVSGVRPLHPVIQPTRPAYLSDSNAMGLGMDPLLAANAFSGLPSYAQPDHYAAAPPLDEPPLPEPAALPAAPAPIDPLEEEFRSVFQDFIDTRQRCGEPTEGVTFDKFAAKLRTNREQLMTRYKCQRVKFQVYVKDGKAALKATPVI